VKFNDVMLKAMKKGFDFFSLTNVHPQDFKRHYHALYNQLCIGRNTNLRKRVTHTTMDPPCRLVISLSFFLKAHFSFKALLCSSFCEQILRQLFRLQMAFSF